MGTDCSIYALPLGRDFGITDKGRMWLRMDFLTAQIREEIARVMSRPSPWLSVFCEKKFPDNLGMTTR